MKTMTIGCYYADYCSDCDSYVVFHTESEHGYASYSSEREANEEANEMNGN